MTPFKRLCRAFGNSPSGSTAEAIAFAELSDAILTGGAATILRNAIAGLSLPGTHTPSAEAADVKQADAAPAMRKA